MHESFYDCIASRVVATSGGDLFNSEVMVHRRNESTHELGRVVAPELKWDSFDEYESREKGPCHFLLLAIRKKPKADFSSHKIYRHQDFAIGVSIEVDARLTSLRHHFLLCREIGMSCHGCQVSRMRLQRLSLEFAEAVANQLPLPRQKYGANKCYPTIGPCFFVVE
jgi:hypothetical protein